MKKIVLAAISVFAFATLASCYEKPVTFEQLPAAAQTYISSNFPSVKVTVATKDDDLIRPDYDVRLSDGTMIEFDHSGALKKVSSKNGISSDLVPAAIRDYVNKHYPEAGFMEYEVGRRTHEVKLTNRLEFKFNSNYHLVEVDD
jgi:hypothetical protein